MLTWWLPGCSRFRLSVYLKVPRKNEIRNETIKLSESDNCPHPFNSKTSMVQTGLGQ